MLNSHFSPGGAVWLWGGGDISLLRRDPPEFNTAYIKQKIKHAKHTFKTIAMLFPEITILKRLFVQFFVCPGIIFILFITYKHLLVYKILFSLKLRYKSSENNSNSCLVIVTNYFAQPCIRYV